MSFACANLIQIPAVILTGGIAWLVCRPLQRWIRGRVSGFRRIIISTGSSLTGHGSSTG